MATTYKELKILVVDELPVGEAIKPFSIYLHKDPVSNIAGFYKSSIDGTKLEPIDDYDSVLGKLIHYGPTVPESTSPAVIWFNNGKVFTAHPGSQGAVSWLLSSGQSVLYGTEDPASNQGIEGDLYIKGNGAIFRRTNVGWGNVITLATNVPTIAYEDTGLLFEMVAPTGLQILLETVGLLVHEAGNSSLPTPGPGGYYFPSGNGRWKLEIPSWDYLTIPLIFELGQNRGSPVGSPNKTPFGTEMVAYIDWVLKKRFLRGFFRPPYVSINNTYFDIQVPDAKVGWGCIISPNHQTFATCTINGYIATDGILTIKVSHTGQVASPITADWSYIIYPIDSTAAI